MSDGGFPRPVGPQNDVQTRAREHLALVVGKEVQHAHADHVSLLISELDHLLRNPNSTPVRQVRQRILTGHWWLRRSAVVNKLQCGWNSSTNPYVAKPRFKISWFKIDRTSPWRAVSRERPSYVEWCIRQLALVFSIIICSITSIAYNHPAYWYNDICPLLSFKHITY